MRRRRIVLRNGICEYREVVLKYLAGGGEPFGCRILRFSVYVIVIVTLFFWAGKKQEFKLCIRVQNV
jgi:hypothetical protein